MRFSMRGLRALWMRLRGMASARRAEDDFAAEIESHVAMHTEDGVRAGLSRDEARRQALVRLGGAEQARQAYRERRTLPGLENLLRDLRYAIRTLGKHRGATAIAVLSIGLGIGANATIFSMVSRFVLRPAPMGDPATLLALHTVHDGDQCCNNFSLPVYTDVRDQAQSFSGVAAYFELVPASISGSGEPERVFGQATTTNFFEVTELPMVLGRGFVKGEENAPEVVLGAALWQRRFNADKEIVGKTVTISGHAFTVVGVVTPAFHSVDQILGTEFWVPLGNVTQLVAILPAQDSRDSHWLAVVGRLKAGVTRAQAAAELNTLADRFALNNSKTDKGNHLVFEQAGSLEQGNRRMMMLFLTALSVVVLLVLSIAGANVANLLFAQAAGRQRDMAVRLALGATRGRLRRQMLMESLLLGLGGGVLGVLSLWATRALSRFICPRRFPRSSAFASIGACWSTLGAERPQRPVAGPGSPAWAASRPQACQRTQGRRHAGASWTPHQPAQSTGGRADRHVRRSALHHRALSAQPSKRGHHRHRLSVSKSAAPFRRSARARKITRRSAPRNFSIRVAAVAQSGSAWRCLRRATDVAPLSGGNRSDSFVTPPESVPITDASTAFADLYMVYAGIL
jgi:hypothetical protein